MVGKRLRWSIRLTVLQGSGLVGFEATHERLVVVLQLHGRIWVGLLTSPMDGFRFEACEAMVVWQWRFWCGRFRRLQVFGLRWSEIPRSTLDEEARALVMRFDQRVWMEDAVSSRDLVCGRLIERRDQADLGELLRRMDKNGVKELVAGD